VPGVRAEEPGDEPGAEGTSAVEARRSRATAHLPGGEMSRDENDIVAASRVWAQRWIEGHMDKWWGPWANDIHHDLAAELVRQMEWARASSPDTHHPLTVAPDDWSVPDGTKA